MDKEKTKSSAGIVDVKILEQFEIQESDTISPVGRYEYIRAQFTGEIDVQDELNARIRNLEHAPRLANGRVRYATDVHIVAPLLPKEDLSLFVNVVNRGGWIGRLPDFSKGIEEISPLEDAVANGIGYLMSRGLAVAWIGWQGDLPNEPGLIRAELPVAKGFTGFVREEVIVDSPVAGRKHSIKDGLMDLELPYPILDVATLELSVRARADDHREPLGPRTFSVVSPNRIRLTLDPTKDAGAIFELGYLSTDPIISGVSFAIMRDSVAFLRETEQSQQAPLNPLRQLGHNIGSTFVKGYSQGARCLREFLRDGYNTALNGSRVFDGMYLIAGGARITKANSPFWQVSRFSRQHEDSDAPDFEFPFAFAESKDSFSGAMGSILTRANRVGTVPKIVNLETDTEFWQARASLLVTSTDGTPLIQPEPVRLYYVAGQHVMGTPEALGTENHGQMALNDLDWRFVSRALCAALIDWVTKDALPPASRFPNHADGTLVPCDAGTRKHHYPGWPSEGDVIARARIFKQHSPESAGSPETLFEYPLFRPTTDRYGNPVGGIQLPELVAPEAAYSGRNLRKKGHAENELFITWGSRRPLPAELVTESPEDRWNQKMAQLSVLVAERFCLPADEAHYREHLSVKFGISPIRETRLEYDSDRKTI